MINVAEIVPQLEELHQETKISLTIISNSESAFKEYFGSAKFPTRYFPWKYETFRSLFSLHDICILPIRPNPFTVCKSNNRVVLSLMLGLPVVTTAIPSYEEFAP